MKRLNVYRSASFAALAMLSSAAWASNYGVWTSADMNNNTAAASMPTPYGYSQGDTTVTIDPITGPGTDYAGYGSYDPVDNGYINTLSIDPGTGLWEFTPTTYYVEAGAFFDGPGGNLLFQGYYNELKDTVTFHLDQPTAYSVGGPVQIDAVYPPMLTGPVGQTITIDGAMSGTLAAGDWTLSMDIVGLTQSDWSAGVYDGGHVDDFLLTVPEPVGAIAMIVPLLGLRRKRVALGAASASKLAR